MSRDKFPDRSYVFSALKNEWARGDGCVLSDVKLIHTGDFSRPHGININHLWGHLHWGDTSHTKAEPPNTHGLTSTVQPTRRTTQGAHHRITAISHGWTVNPLWVTSSFKRAVMMPRVFVKHRPLHETLCLRIHICLWLSGVFSIKRFHLPSITKWHLMLIWLIMKLCFVVQHLSCVIASLCRDEMLRPWTAEKTSFHFFSLICLSQLFELCICWLLISSTCVRACFFVQVFRRETRDAEQERTRIWVQVCSCMGDIVSSYLVTGTEGNRGGLVLKSKPLEGGREENESTGATGERKSFCCFCRLQRHKGPGLLCLKAWEQPLTDGSASPLPNFNHVAAKYLTQSWWRDKSGVAVLRSYRPNTKKWKASINMPSGPKQMLKLPLITSMRHHSPSPEKATFFWISNVQCCSCKIVFS